MTMICKDCRVEGPVQRYDVIPCQRHALVERLAEALRELYTYPRVRDLLAPKESMGSIDRLCEDVLTEYDGLEKR